MFLTVGLYRQSIIKSYSKWNISHESSPPEYRSRCKRVQHVSVTFYSNKSLDSHARGSNHVCFPTQHQHRTVLGLNSSWADHSAVCAALALTGALDLITATQWLDYSRHWAKNLDDFLMGIDERRETPTVGPVYWQYFSTLEGKCLFNRELKCVKYVFSEFF